MLAEQGLFRLWRNSFKGMLWVRMHVRGEVTTDPVLSSSSNETMEASLSLKSEGDL